jgi:hypothetical protein
MEKLPDNPPKPRPVRVFISGPLRGLNEFEIRQNREAARREAEFLWRAGAAPFCPHLNTAGMAGMVGILGDNEEAFLAGDLRWLAVADFLFVLPQWEFFVGSRSEVSEANRLGIPMFFRRSEYHYAHSVLGSPDLPTNITEKGVRVLFASSSYASWLENTHGAGTLAIWRNALSKLVVPSAGTAGI